MKKAFTLVELLAVIIVLGIVLAITVPSIQSYINNSKSNVYDVAVNEFKRAAKSYVEQYSPVMDSLQTSGVDFVTIQQMVDKGFLKAPINNPQTGTEFNYNGAVKVIRNENGYFDFNFYINGVTDTVRPVLALLGNATVTIEAGSTYVDAGATATDDVGGNITSSIVATSDLNSTVTGTYKMTYNVSDAADNPAYSISRTIIVVDTTAPIVAFSPNGNNTYAKTRNATVNISDNGTVDTSTLKYLWNASTTTPSEGSFSTTFTNGGSVSTPAGLTGGYYLWILAKDTKSNTAITRSNVFNLDNTIPVITVNGTNPISVSTGSTYSDAGATASDNSDGNITASISVTSNVNTSAIGSYTVTYNVSDSSGNVAASVTRTVNVLDLAAPTVAFGTNGNATYAKARSTTVTVSDNIAVNTSSLKYQWTTSTTAPTEASFSTTFTNAGTISSPAGVTGGYYLWILAKDTSNNTSILGSNVFNLDNTVPVITVSGTNPIYLALNASYTDAGATASDNVDGNITSSITSSSTVNIAVPGIYTVTYNVNDSSGNAATPVTRTVYVGDSTPPTVAFGTNGNSTYAKTRSTTVTVSDSISGVNASTLKYQWNTSTTAPTEASFSTTFTNAGTISSPAGVSGGYYLWILAKDNMNNTAILKSNVFNLDNTSPIITMNGSTTVTVYTGSAYTDAGATATDNVDSSVTVNVVSTVNINTAGTYTVTYTATDSCGNAATAVVRTVNVQSLSSVEYLIVAGGGGAGGRHGGGGGAGGLLYGTTSVASTSYGITVGGGGGPGTGNNDASNRGSSGGNSAAFGLTAIGGGAGAGGWSPSYSPYGGGSGGGGAASSTGAGGTSGQGGNGGNGIATPVYGGGGGGGACANGGSAYNNAGGNGGNGCTWSNGVTYAGGGAGGSWTGSGGYGGSGGGGNAGVAGANGYGGGGGGGMNANGGTYGGSGVVIIRYPSTVQRASGGSVSSSGGYIYHTFTGAGTFTVW